MISSWPLSMSLRLDALRTMDMFIVSTRWATEYVEIGYRLDNEDYAIQLFIHQAQHLFPSTKKGLFNRDYFLPYICLSGRSYFFSSHWKCQWCLIP